jgi:hypothetical protein
LGEVGMKDFIRLKELTVGYKNGKVWVMDKKCVKRKEYDVGEHPKTGDFIS